MTDKLCGEVVAAGVRAVICKVVKYENSNRLSAFDLLFNLGNLFLHAVNNFFRTILYPENSAKVVEILINVVKVSAQLVALDRGKGHYAVA